MRYHEIDRWCARCKPGSLHAFINEVSDSEPPVDSTHLSDLPTALSPSRHSDMDVDSNTTTPDGDSSALLQMPTPSPPLKIPTPLLLLQMLTPS